MYRGSQSVARAVVSWFATVSGAVCGLEDEGKADEREEEGVEEAVVEIFGKELG